MKRRSSACNKAAKSEHSGSKQSPYGGLWTVLKDLPLCRLWRRRDIVHLTQRQPFRHTIAQSYGQRCADTPMYRSITDIPGIQFCDPGSIAPPELVLSRFDVRGC
eukprot:scaffold301832_cov18-Prasinocladus_malaysianus.AAC.1